MRRVLRPGGKGLIIDLRSDVSMAEINRYIARAGTGLLEPLDDAADVPLYAAAAGVYRVAGFEKLLAGVGVRADGDRDQRDWHGNLGHFVTRIGLRVGAPDGRGRSVYGTLKSCR